MWRAKGDVNGAEQLGGIGDGERVLVGGQRPLKEHDTRVARFNVQVPPTRMNASGLPECKCQRVFLGAIGSTDGSVVCHKLNGFMPFLFKFIMVHVGNYGVLEGRPGESVFDMGSEETLRLVPNRDTNI